MVIPFDLYKYLFRSRFSFPDSQTKICCMAEMDEPCSRLYFAVQQNSFCRAAEKIPQGSRFL